MTKLSALLNGLMSVSDPYTVMYANAMQRLQDDHQATDAKLGLTTICWPFLSKRPLRLKELLHALAIDEDTPSFDEENVPLVSHIVDACAGLIVVDETKNTIGLFHKTFHEYLVKNQSHWFPNGNDTIGTTCVRYLSLDVFANGLCHEARSKPALTFADRMNERASPYTKRLRQFSLYDYASWHWGDHVRGSDLEIADSVMTFLATPNKLTASWQRPEVEYPQTTGIHVAERFSLRRSLERHIELCRPDPNLKDGSGRSPLSYAAEFNSVAVIELLVDAGANPNLEDNLAIGHYVSQRALTPLSFAAIRGHLLACKILLRRGATVDYRDRDGRDALSFAAQGGSAAVCRLLLQNGCQIDSKDNENRTALRCATEAGSTEVVSLLTDHTAITNQAGYRMTPLHAAAEAGCEPLISFLVARGADVNSIPSADSSPLSEVVKLKLLGSVRLLLAAGAKVDVHAFPMDPLTQACKTGPKRLVSLLLAAGGNVRHMNYRMVPPLAYVARNGWKDLVQTFLDAGAPIEYMYKGFATVLPLAVESGSTECVELLLERGADINQVNHETPFCEQIYYPFGMRRIGAYHEGFILDHPHDDRPATCCIDYSQPRVPDAEEDMLRLLLSSGANPNRLCSFVNPKHNLGSPLFYALKYTQAGDPETKRMIELLLEYGAKIDEEDDKEAVLVYMKRHGDDVQNLLHQYGIIGDGEGDIATYKGAGMGLEASHFDTATPDP
jgi:ankyrin repeat protein